MFFATDDVKMFFVAVTFALSFVMNQVTHDKLIDYEEQFIMVCYDIMLFYFMLMFLTIATYGIIFICNVYEIINYCSSIANSKSGVIR